jgi:hypothetical protein
MLAALMLGACAGQGLSLGAKDQPPATDTSMPGRWILAAPGAPSCGMNFFGAAGARAGKVTPEGGCPGNFFLSRRWTLEADVLVIADDDNNALARLPSAGGGYEGQSAAGLPVTLARQPVLAAPGN